MSSKLEVVFKEVVGGRTSSRIPVHPNSRHYTLVEDNDESGNLSISFHDVHELLEQNLKLKQSMATLRNAPHGTLIQDSSLQEAISSADTAMSSIDPHITSLWNQIPAQQKPIMHNNNAAQAVFDIPELLELILLKLPVKDILRAQGVSHGWKDQFKTSINLQQALCLKPAFNYYSPFDTVHPRDEPNSWPGMTYRSSRWSPYNSEGPLQARPVDNDMKFQICVDLTGSTFTLGKTCLAMFLCQPPPKEATIYAESSSDIFDPAPMVHLKTKLLLKSADGLTVGDLCNGAADLSSYTMGKLDKAEDEYNMDFNTHKMYLEAVVKLADNDPIMTLRREAAERAAQHLKEKAIRQGKRAADGEEEYDSEYSAY